MGVDVDLHGGVHANDTEALDDLGGVGNSLASQKDLVGVGVPVIVEALEAIGREADGGGSGVVEFSRVEEVEESILNNLGPNLEVLELGIIKTTDNGVGDVSDSRLQRQEVGGHAAVSDLMLEELNQVTSDLARGVVHVGIRAGLVPVIGLDNGDDLGGVDLDRRGANAILNSGNVIGCAVGRNVGEGDIVETLKGGDRGVDLNDDLPSAIVSFSSPCRRRAWQ